MPSSPSMDHPLRFGKNHEIKKVNSSTLPGFITRLSHSEPVGSTLTDFLRSKFPSSTKSSHISSNESRQVKSAHDVRYVGCSGFKSATEKFPKFSSFVFFISDEYRIAEKSLFSIYSLWLIYEKS